MGLAIVTLREIVQCFLLSATKHSFMNEFYIH